MVDPYIPQKQDERLWIPVSGFLPIKPPTRRAMSEGTKGVLRFMDEYKSHAGVQQECCFGLITLAQRTEEALIFKERLVKEGVIARVTTALARFSAHYGLQKQGLGVIHYILFGTETPKINIPFSITIDKACNKSNLELLCFFLLIINLKSLFSLPKFQ